MPSKNRELVITVYLGLLLRVHYCLANLRFSGA